MKKLIAAITLLLAFTINANAQDKKAVGTPIELAKKEAAELSTAVGLTPTQVEDFVRLFESKNKTLQETNLSAERKTALANVIEAKIRATLDEKQTAKLEKNQALLTKLTH